MCLGVPARIDAIVDEPSQRVSVSLNGVLREVNASCVWTEPAETLIGQWALIHVGFAMALLSEEEAQQTLDALAAMGADEHEMADFSGLGAAR
ncbi:hydrogenase assembly chaperone hypC/hupF [Ferrimonas balearica DSM 9799]|uniref:Hydrogenase assembly chaperone hypC/hupF n=1 Tax=Ferrimonas balearica (strain DSM 9799 / CCM 4581 / KCTC 23876 / PAT) TaxID=550540 RepID=E1SV52_FERBD|nr:HypC/HybG/HupF family hydrogenase formation chaperone [Ferrimonas balearica]MBY6017851.1 HypC/HybG/HupF family hydrogenase formation chaperone [Halomonas denitrificans]ADN77352.1 hydrogenase assembly chaperone hypC/hupF [Ferrimonas balearica DSM 9799]MBW3139658.1 HypC/HybG/HupF family hydrogenase formation chaperone [Ferrimonas balearica]MBW3164684.1 HypC/HybG/HupF family hydrogenase formation chaperone [Ferrimonas balearica]MBY5980454.1 HypC/HybG/HupF family hydrogenase formation chaperone